MTGGPIVGRSALHAALEHIGRQYSRYDVKTLAVRGERLILAASSWSDEAGNQSSFLLVIEIGEDDRIVRHVAFNEDDFDSAYSELESRYYAGEGAAFASNGLIVAGFLRAAEVLDVEAARLMCAPDFMLMVPPTAMAPQVRSLDEFFQWQRDRTRQVSSVKYALPAIRWLSPACSVFVADIQARGTDAEEYGWARIYVAEFSDGLLASIRQFDHEEDAFAYAEVRVRLPVTRLAVTNTASAAFISLLRAMQAGDLTDAPAGAFEQLVGQDRDLPGPFPEHTEGGDPGGAGGAGHGREQIQVGVQLGDHAGGQCPAGWFEGDPGAAVAPAEGERRAEGRQHPQVSGLAQHQRALLHDGCPGPGSQRPVTWAQGG